MWLAILTTPVLLYTTLAAGDYGVFCPESAGDNAFWSDLDIGINIWSSSGSRADDCFLRVSTLYNEHSSIGTEWINPSKDMIVMIHGWQGSSVDPDDLTAVSNEHYISDQWGYLDIMDECTSSANSGDIEDCPPMDHDAQFWIENGWNVLFVDWKYYAATDDVVEAEQTLYDQVHDGKSVNSQNQLLSEIFIFGVNKLIHHTTNR